MQFSVNTVLAVSAAISGLISVGSATGVENGVATQVENPSTVDFHSWKNLWGVWPIKGDSVVGRDLSSLSDEEFNMWLTQDLLTRSVAVESKAMMEIERRKQLKAGLLEKRHDGPHDDVTTTVAVVETITTCSTLTLTHSLSLPSEIVNPSTPLTGTDSIVTEQLPIPSTVHLTLSLVPDTVAVNTSVSETSGVPTASFGSSSSVPTPNDIGSSTSVSATETASNTVTASESGSPPASGTPTPTGTSGGNPLDIYGAVGGLVMLAVGLILTL